MERDKFLTEAMGFSRIIITDFGQWGGFGLLWTWAQEQEWWKEFVISIMEIGLGRNIGLFFLPLAYTNPDRFANAVYEFLKERT